MKHIFASSSSKPNQDFRMTDRPSSPPETMPAIARRKGTATESEILQIQKGKELADTTKAAKEGKPLSSRQQKLLKEGSFTVNRRALDAYRALMKVKDLEVKRKIGI